MTVLKYLIPIFLFVVSFSIQGRIDFRFSVKDSVLALGVSALVLVPFWYISTQSGKSFALLPLSALLIQFAAIALPEEVYFRGFLQNQLGNTIRAVFLVSLLFSFMHMPQFIFYGDISSLLTFFPSLIMGYLYMKTSNVLTSTIFHFLANAVFLGFCDIL